MRTLDILGHILLVSLKRVALGLCPDLTQDDCFDYDTEPYLSQLTKGITVALLLFLIFPIWSKQRHEILVKKQHT